VILYIPNFKTLFNYESYNISYKCKFKNSNDDRSVKFYKNNNILNFIGGKITGIFSMAKILFDEFENVFPYALNDIYDMIEKDK
jgi:hypothetical protein